MYKTERLMLKTASEMSIEPIIDYYRDNELFFKQFEPQRDDNYYTYRHQSLILSNDRYEFETKTGLKLFIYLSSGNQLIGILNFTQIIMGAFKSCFIGYNQDKKKTGNGYMTEAITKGIQIMFEEYDLHRIEGNVMPVNKASLKVLEKLNFTYEGTAKKYLMINGAWEDHMHYVLLNEVTHEEK